MSNETKNGLANFGKGALSVLGCMFLGALALYGDNVRYEDDKKNSDDFKEVMAAIINSDMSSYYQKEIIEKIATKKLTRQQQESVIAICKSEMNDYYKFETITKIVD